MVRKPSPLVSSKLLAAITLLAAVQGCTPEVTTVSSRTLVPDEAEPASESSETAEVETATPATSGKPVVFGAFEASLTGGNGARMSVSIDAGPEMVEGSGYGELTPSIHLMVTDQAGVTVSSLGQGASVQLTVQLEGVVDPETLIVLVEAPNGQRSFLRRADLDITSDANGMRIVFRVGMPEAMITVAQILDLSNDKLLTAVDDTFTVDEDVAQSLAVLSNDSVGLKVVSTGAATKGIVTIEASGKILYAPNLNQTGVDSFTYAAVDANGAKTEAKVSLTIRAVNDAPTLTLGTVGGSAPTGAGTLASPHVLARAEASTTAIGLTSADVDSLAPVIACTGLGAWGSQSASGVDLAFGYADAGSHSFQCQATDDKGLVSNVLHVSVNVANTNRAPLLSIADPHTFNIAEGATQDLTLTPTDPDLADPTSLTLSCGTLPAWLTLDDASRTLTVAPGYGVASHSTPGSASVTCEASDGSLTSSGVTLSITVTDVNRAPLVADDTALTLLNAAKIITVLANDSDPDGDDVSVDSATNGANGTVVVNVDGTVTYTPANGFLGSDTFTYSAIDSEGDETEGAVTIYVAGGFTWIGSASNPKWNNAAAWAGGSVPGAGDTAVFSGACLNLCNVTIDHNMIVGAIAIEESYTGTITQAPTRTIDVGDFTQAGGMFAGGDAAFGITGNLSISGGTFRATSGTTTSVHWIGDWSSVTGPLVKVTTDGAFEHNDGRFTFASRNTCAANAVWEIDATGTTIEFFDVRIAMINPVCGHWGTMGAKAGGNVVITNDLTVDSGRMQGDWRLQGNLAIGASSQYDRGRILFVGPEDQTYAYTAGGVAPILVVDTEDGVVSPASGTTGLHATALHLVKGKFTAPTGTLELSSITGDFEQPPYELLSVSADSIFDPSTGLVKAHGKGNCPGHNWTIGGGVEIPFNDFEIAAVVGACGDLGGLSVALGTTALVAGDFFVTAGRMASGLVKVSGDLAVGTAAAGGHLEVEMVGATASTYEYAAGGVGPVLIVNKAGGSLGPKAGTTDLKFWAYKQVAGSFVAPSGNMTLSFWTPDWIAPSRSIFEQSGGTFTYGSGTLVFAARAGCPGHPFYVTGQATIDVGNVVVDSPSGACGARATIAAGSGVTVVHHGTLTVTNGAISGTWSP